MSNGFENGTRGCPILNDLENALGDRLTEWRRYRLADLLDLRGQGSDEFEAFGEALQPQRLVDR